MSDPNYRGSSPPAERQEPRSTENYDAEPTRPGDNRVRTYEQPAGSASASSGMVRTIAIIVAIVLVVLLVMWLF